MKRKKVISPLSMAICSLCASSLVCLTSPPPSWRGWHTLMMFDDKGGAFRCKYIVGKDWTSVEVNWNELGDAMVLLGDNIHRKAKDELKECFRNFEAWGGE